MDSILVKVKRLQLQLKFFEHIPFHFFALKNSTKSIPAGILPNWTHPIPAQSLNTGSFHAFYLLRQMNSASKICCEN